MASPAAEAARLDGLALLDALRPPQGWRTVAALGTTYSLELPVCVACLISLSGTARDTSDYTFHGALRALQTLRDRVRVVAQEGCIARPPTARSGILHLLDALVRTVRYPGGGRSFHPKVWLVRFEKARGDEPEQWRLVVGSRNLTSAAAWDLGVSLDGQEGIEGEELSEVWPFVREVAKQAGLEDFIPRLDRVRHVRWVLPLHSREVQFGFQGDRTLSWQETALYHLGDEGVRRVLAISPFLDAAAVSTFERRSRVDRPFDERSRRLVAGFADLEKLARTKTGHAALVALSHRESGDDIRGVATASPEASLEEHDDAEPAATSDERLADLGLHAKAIVAWHARDDVSLLLGSPNLTTRGWRGANVEAWIRVRGRSHLAEPLWAWSAMFPSFTPPPAPLDVPPRVEETLEDVVDEIRDGFARVELELREHDDGRPPELVSPYPPPARVRDCDVRVHVARLSSIDAPCLWPAEARKVELPSCPLAERSAFVVLRVGASQGDVEVVRTWTQRVRVEPAIDLTQRDAQAIRRVLGAEGFLAYLRGLLDPAMDDADSGDPGGDEDGSGSIRKAADRADPGLSLEVLLRSLARRGPQGEGEIVDTLARAIEGYRSAAGSDKDPKLVELWDAWDALFQSMKQESDTLR